MHVFCLFYEHFSLQLFRKTPLRKLIGLRRFGLVMNKI